MTYKKIDNTRLSDLVAKQLKESIFSGQYRPGQRIPSEFELVKAFGVSRAIVREAIRDMEKSGLLEVRRGPKGGAVVQTMRHDAVTSVMRDVLSVGRVTVPDIMEVRLDIEPVVAGLAAERATPQDLEDIRNNLFAVPEAPGDMYVSWNMEFHRLIASASHNPMYNTLVNILTDFTEELVLSLMPIGKVVHSPHWHPAIFQKIENRDAKGARQAFREHLQAISPVLIELERTNLSHKMWDQAEDGESATEREKNDAASG